MKNTIILLMIFFAAIYGISSGQEVKTQSLFTDHKSHRVGDLITVLIVESSSASNNAKTVTEKSTTTSTDGTAGVGPLDFIPMWGASGGNETKYDGKGQTSKSGSLSARMTVIVTEVKPNGDLVIEGNRVVKIDNDEETLFLSGTVRSKDVAQDNTIYSYQIANALISTKSKGTTNTGNRPGFITRVINWIF